MIVCPAGSDAPPTIAAARAGKHVFVEKPMCYHVWEAKAMVEAAQESGVVLQVGYMKRHDPGSSLRPRARPRNPDVRFVQVNHLHPNNDLHLKEFKVLRFNDIPPEAGVALRKEDAMLTREAIGEATPAEIRAIILYWVA